MTEIDVKKVLGKKKKENNFKPTLGKFGRSALALVFLSFEMIDDITGLTSLRGKQGLWDFARKMNMGEYSLGRIIGELEREGFLRRKEKKLFITPKGRRRVQKLKLRAPTKLPGEWDGKWREVIFDIPEDMRAQRNFFRALLKRKGFIKLQNSVFVAPNADFDELDLARREYGIEKYVNFLIAESAATDDDSFLRKRFSLKVSAKKRDRQ